MPLTSFDDLLDEQLTDPQMTQLYKQERRRLDAAIEASRVRPIRPQSSNTPPVRSANE